MAIVIRRRQKKRDISGAAIGLTKAIASLVTTIFSHNVDDIRKGSGAFFTNLIDSALAFNKDVSKQIDYDAWDLLRASFASGLAIFISKVELRDKPQGKILEQFVQKILERTEKIMDRNHDVISADIFVQPLLIPTLRDASKCIPLDIKEFNPIKQPNEIRREFENCLFLGVEAVKNTKPELFKSVESAISGLFVEATEKRSAKLSHEAFIIRGFTQTPIFGQEDTGLTISDLYVKQRCLYFKKELLDTKKESNIQEVRLEQKTDYKKRFVKKLHISDLHSEIDMWLAERSAEEAIKVVAGGPGSGKSTFARAIAIENIDKQIYDVLFIPLQDIPSGGSFEQRIATLCLNRTELGFDRVDSPLQWLGRTKPDGSAPLKPLLLICDGLDEIAPPDSREAATVTTDFIQALSTWINARNSAGCYVKCIVLGRDGAAEEAFEKIAIDSEHLIYVGGLRPLSNRIDWQNYRSRNLFHDKNDLSKADQRVDYWKKWASFFKLQQNEVPIGLTQEADGEKALQELTAEPLLLYLLLLTDYLGSKWREAAENRNVVYQEIFNRIYRRDWGNTKSNSRIDDTISGGHVTTENLKKSEFMALQEALGLAAWPSGGRVVSQKQFERTLKMYLSEEMFYKLNKNVKVSLKSVALHSYTRNSELDESGYEFVHKSLGEYLIGRGLVEINLRSLNDIGQLFIEERFIRSASLVASIASLGTLTSEIARFFNDEMSLRFACEEIDLNNCVNVSVFLTNWLLRNRFPITEKHFIEKEVKFIEKSYADLRSMDVYWFFTQALYSIRYTDASYMDVNSSKYWESGPIKIEWPTASTCCDLISYLSNRHHVNEAGRFSSFDRLNFAGQILTDIYFGAVTFDIRQNNVPFPKNWLSFSARGSFFDRAAFFASNFHSADLSMSIFRDCTFTSCIMRDAILYNCNFIDSEFAITNIRGSYFTKSSFKGCRFEGLDAWGASFEDTSFEICNFDLYTEHYDFGKRTENCIFEHTQFINAKFIDVNFGSNRFVSCNFKGSEIFGCSMGSSKFKGCDFENSIIADTKLNKNQEISLHTNITIAYKDSIDP